MSNYAFKCKSCKNNVTTLTYFLNNTKLGKGAQNKLGEGETF